MRSPVLIAMHLACVAGVAMARGPHHPRGESVVRQHVHYMPTKGAPDSILHDDRLMHDTHHLQEHLDAVVAQPPNLDNLTDDELDFYYFQLHDTDQNSKLDGLEILQAIQHTRHHQQQQQQSPDAFVDEENDPDSQPNQQATTEEDPDNTLEFYIELIDKVFVEDDTDNDGYLSYVEYKAGREKEAKIASVPPILAIPSVEEI